MESEFRDPQRTRVALYSHDTMGLGHMRRNLLIADSLVRSSEPPVVLLIAGAREAGGFAFPPGVDCVTLPSLRKEGAGQYASRHLDVQFEDLHALRSHAIRAVLEEFAPDVLIVDNVPRGAVRELDPALTALRARGRTRCVLGLRDVLDEPRVVRWEWDRAANEDALREYYDAIWVYGDPTVYPLDDVCEFSADLKDKTRYTGYLDQTLRTRSSEGLNKDELDRASESQPERLVLCLVGGGQDGAALAEAFTQAELPDGSVGVLLTGPFMPAETRESLMRRASASSRLRVLQFVAEPGALLRRADRVIAMGGYNTVTEVLSYEKDALIVPRVEPRLEQLIRAEALRERGILDVLHPDELNSGTLSAWLQRETRHRVRSRERVDLSGLQRLPEYLDELLRGATNHSRVTNQHELVSAG